MTGHINQDSSVFAGLSGVTEPRAPNAAELTLHGPAPCHLFIRFSGLKGLMLRSLLNSLGLLGPTGPSLLGGGNGGSSG